MSAPVWVINRDTDAARLGAFTEAAGALGITPGRVAAIDGHDPGFPSPEDAALIGPSFWGGDNIKPGALACFLSHRRAWERLLESGAPHALICEDDAVLDEGPARALAVIEGRDLLFCNQRLAGWAGVAGVEEASVPLGQMLAAVAAMGGPRKIRGLRPAPGADCYLISARGAETLLRLSAADGVRAGVDWTMIWYGLDTDPPETRLPEAFDELATLARCHVPRPAALGAAVLAAPLAHQSGGFPSVLRHDVTAPLGRLRQRAAALDRPAP